MNHFLNGWKGSKEGCEWREDVPSGFPPIDPSELVTNGCGKLIDPLWNWSFSLKWNIRFGFGWVKNFWVRENLGGQEIHFQLNQMSFWSKRNIFVPKYFLIQWNWFSFSDKINSKFRVLILIYLWRFIWVLRFELEVNRFLQRLHSHGFSPVWTSSCFCKCASWVKDFVHFVHLKGRSPVCTRLWT